MKNTLCLAIALYVGLFFATTALAADADVLAVMRRDEQCDGLGGLLQEIESAVTQVLPMLQPILMAAGMPEIGPIVQVAVTVLKALHLFC
ncbi:hypothetical protein MSPP1_000829 [Malassezia sp. CBS 17886]|nr:hypothetical protein MSPP1_000829 [Malassezia sp. CBS 17886]